MFSSGDRPAATPASQALSDAPPALDASEALRLINDYRATKKLRPISLDSNASAAAQILAKDMAQNDRMSHTGPDGADVGKRLTMSGYSYRLAAENVGVGQKSLAELIEGWKRAGRIAGTCCSRRPSTSELPTSTSRTRNGKPSGRLWLQRPDLS